MPANSSLDLNNLTSGSPLSHLVDWSQIDHVLLDMDGTLIDLNYDNHVWNDLVPAAFAHQAKIELAQAKAQLHRHMDEIHGTISFYSFDYWSRYCGISMIDVHNLVTEMIDYRSGVVDFLAWLEATGRPAIIATNAHRDSIVIKEKHTGITARVDAVVSSHDYGYPKEDPRFWQMLHQHHPFDPRRTLFIDDNEPVLDAAAAAGIQHLLCITQPDSNRAERLDLRYPSFNCFRDLFD